ncbi:MAG: rRNA maturation RNase YbeY [Ignavibacteriales bacterium]|jgi:probable rRNA maturation factor|nr:rRNA maturation RNase YbeY [Ignavibacteriales bacterium]
MKNIDIEIHSKPALTKTVVKTIVNEVSKIKDCKFSYLEISFVSKEIIHEINKEHLKHDFPTDIITFEYENSDEGIDGELIICSEVAMENAERFEVSVESELLRLVIHGILHLIGYNDTEEETKRIMKSEEDRLVELLYPKLFII